MDSLDSIKQPTIPSSRLYLGIGLFTAGLIPAAIGGVRVVEQLLTAFGAQPESSLITGIAASGLGISLVLFLLTFHITTNQTVETTAKFGVGTMILGTTLFILNAPTGGIPQIVSPSVFIYAIGFVLLYGSLLTSLAIIVTPAPKQFPSSTSSNSGYGNSTWKPSSSQSFSRNPTQLPTDGGEEDNDLSFPLDDNDPPK